MFSSYQAIENGIDDDYKALNPIIDSKKLLVIVDRNNKFLGFKVGDGKTKYNDIDFIKLGNSDKSSEKLSSKINIFKGCNDYLEDNILSEISCQKL